MVSIHIFSLACEPALLLVLSKAFVLARENQGEGACKEGGKGEPAGKTRVYEY